MSSRVVTWIHTLSVFIERLAGFVFLVMIMYCSFSPLDVVKYSSKILQRRDISRYEAMTLLDLWPINTHLPLPGMLHSLVVALFVLSPFPFYWYLWTYPRKWLKMCEGVDPSHRMAQVAHLLKALQIVGLLSVATLSVLPIICVALFGLGQFLNYRVMDLLGEGVYYGARFGKKLPWMEKFPFGYFRDPQYVGSIMSLLGVSCWVPFRFIALWIIGYFFMMVIEREEDSNSREEHIS